MNVEALLLIACLHGNEQSCLTSAQAYYKYSNLEQITQHIETNIREQHKVIYYTGLVVASATERKATIPLVYNFSLSSDLNTTMLKWGFGW